MNGSDPVPPCVHQYARVWLPDAAEVWKSAELIKDYTPGDLKLTVQLDDGTVRQANDTHSHTLGDRGTEVEMGVWCSVREPCTYFLARTLAVEPHKSVCALGLFKADVVFGKMHIL